MSPVSLGLDGLLIVLLLAALAVGLRLNAKLKLLRDSQAGFIKAVAELDQAAMRAEAGLASLRSATMEAHDALLTRIETARTLSARLDRASEDAEGASARLELAIRRAEEASSAPAPRAAPALRLVEAISAAREEAEPLPMLRPAPLAAPSAPAPAPAPAADDLLARFVARRRGTRA